MAIRLKQPNGVTLHLIVVYAPTKRKSETALVFDERLDAFYDELTAAGKTARVEDFRIVLGDWNAKVGRNKRKDFRGLGAFDKDLARTLGPYGTSARNASGQRALEYAMSENLFFARSFFAGPGSQAARNRCRAYDTWFSNSNCFGGSGNIDHFLVSDSQFRRVKNALASAPRRRHVRRHRPQVHRVNGGSRAEATAVALAAAPGPHRPQLGYCPSR